MNAVPTSTTAAVCSPLAGEPSAPAAARSSATPSSGTASRVREFRTAVVPAAGLGTRFLPATKTVPKELLPLIDTPAIEVIAEEAAASGAERMVVVTRPGKADIRSNFDCNAALEDELRRRGNRDLLSRVQKAQNLLDVDIVEQQVPDGLATAVACARARLTEDDAAVAVLLPDDLIYPVGVLDRMAQVRRRRGGSVLCAVEVESGAVGSFGIVDVQGLHSAVDPDVLRVRGLVEKPDPAAAPSNLAIVGRYLLDRQVFEAIGALAPGHGGEFQLTDAIAALIEQGHPVHVLIHRGTRHDLGTPAGYLRAQVDLALRSAEHGAALREWLMMRLAQGGTDSGNGYRSV